MPNPEAARIVIDSSPLRYLNTGLGQFTFHLLHELSVLPFPDAKLCSLVHPRYAHLVPKGLAIEQATWLRRHASAAVQRHLYRACKVWHMTTENTRLTGVPKGTSVVLTIHGLHFLDESPADEASRELADVQKLVNSASVITVVSAFTADLVRNRLDVKSKPIQVIPNGIARQEIAPSTPTWAPKGKFLFSIGTFFSRKNFHVLIPMMKFFPEYTLILAGDNGHDYGDKVRTLVSDAAVENRILMPGEVTEGEKRWLYSQAEALVFPSVSEGFGIPLIEAFQQGTPVFCGRYGSLPEIGKDHAWYWDNFEPESMATRMREKLLLESTTSRLARVNYAAGFSWAAAAQEYQKIYRSLL